MSTDDNPFSPDRLARLEFRLPAGVSWEGLIARCVETGYCCAIVGPAGSGKSTLLAQLAPYLVALGFNPRFFHLNAESRRVEREALLAEARGMRAPDFLLLDGAEQLQTREWLSLRSAIDGLAGCIITLHRTGRLPTLVETSTTPALIEDLVTELTGGRLPAGEAVAIHARHHGNLRKCFRELHDRWDGG